MDLLCLEFLNTEWSLTHAPHAELLADPSWLSEFVARWELPVDHLLAPHETAQLIDLRSLLSDLTGNICAAGKLTDRHIREINRYLNSVPLCQEMREQAGTYSLVLRPMGGQWPALLYLVTASLAKLLTSCDLKRLKRCENPDCRWVYYDESRSATRRWCGNTCASLVKVRRFRQKKKDQV